MLGDNDDLTVSLQVTPGGPFKLIDDGSFMDVDDQTNSNHANNVDGDEHQSNHLTPEAANSSNSNHLNSSSIPNRNSTSRVCRLVSSDWFSSTLLLLISIRETIDVSLQRAHLADILSSPVNHESV